MPSTPSATHARSALESAAHGVDHYENFPVASWLCPPRLRPAVAAIYWFARTADDIADEGDATPAQRLAELSDYRTALDACIAQPATLHSRWPHVFTPLARVIVAQQLPVHLLHDLLSAFEQDVHKTSTGASYANRTELLDYCRRSANPVGRLLLHLYGVADSTSLAQSDSICSALQLINFWQDLSVDLPRKRYYLPADDCARHGLRETDANLAAHPQTPALVAEQVAWARALMHEGLPLPKRIQGRAGWELRLVVQGGLRVLDRIEAMQFNSAAQRPKLGLRDWLVVGWRALLM